VGKGIQVSRSAEISYVEIKQLVRDRQWRAALPFLLAMIGLFGLIVFGVLALWVKLDDKLVATLIAGVVLFTMGRIGWNVYRA
jgi:cell division protein FtsX